MIFPNTECLVVSISVVHITKLLSDMKNRFIPLSRLVADYTNLPEFLSVLLMVLPVFSVK